MRQPAHASGSDPAAPQPEHRHQPEQPREPVHAPGDAAGAAGQRHQHGALAGRSEPLQQQSAVCSELDPIYFI